ncbi:hypothetical protein JD276_01330 [Leucobacter sp. CSA1]|uniref:Uncharacterized protein n=1 Tax=Leucobacter chromiisoli TaxID=2796471 RepID=A0A934USU8_9MICO|nr:hypothetical protein [Leucobacter chromiisoli]MBK0417679.1 hypothetical protein [Leucobacter chromiisoli]
MYIGPVGSAGQNYQWARALERVRPNTAATSMRFYAGDDTFGYPVDQAVSRDYASRSHKWRRQQREALNTYRAVVVESAMSPFGQGDANGIAEQIRQLCAAGASCALLFHGSDIRDPETHMKAEPRSHFAVDPEFRAKMATRTAFSREVIARTGIPVFVSTPALLSEVEEATWLPVVVDVDAWRTNEPPLAHEGPPRVVHAPSRSFIKGTELIEHQLRAMHEAGEIEYVQVSGIPHAEMPEVYRSADIVLDHFRTGNYGVAAGEAMAAGRVCVSHVSDIVRTRTRELTGEELPIVQATPDDLRDVLLGLANDRPAARNIAEKGLRFVRAWHDGTQSGRVLADWLEQR